MNCSFSLEKNIWDQYPIKAHRSLLMWSSRTIDRHQLDLQDTSTHAFPAYSCGLRLELTSRKRPSSHKGRRKCQLIEELGRIRGKSHSKTQNSISKTHNNQETIKEHDIAFLKILGHCICSSIIWSLHVLWKKIIPNYRFPDLSSKKCRYLAYSAETFNRSIYVQYM